MELQAGDHVRIAYPNDRTQRQWEGRVGEVVSAGGVVVVVQFIINDGELKKAMFESSELEVVSAVDRLADLTRRGKPLPPPAPSPAERVEARWEAAARAREQERERAQRLMEGRLRRRMDG